MKKLDIYKVVSFEQVQEVVDIYKPLAFDTETCGIYGKIRLAQFFQEGWERALLVEWPDAVSLQVLLSKILSYQHNAHYDLTVLNTYGSSKFIPDQIDDTLLLSRLALPVLEEYSFDMCLKAILGYCVYEQAGLDKKELQKSNWDVPVLSEEQLLYAALDVYYAPELYNKVKCAKEDPSYILDIYTLKYCLHFQNHGMPVDEERLEKVYKENLAAIKELNSPINVNSYKQVREFLGSDESDDLALAKMSYEGNEKAIMVRKVRKLLKQNTFINKFRTAADRIFGKFKPTARSGRLTSDDQNLQQIPRSLKKVFGVKKGRKLVFSDYPQLELRTICALVICKAMETLFRNNEDLHAYTSDFLFGSSEDDTKERKKYKRQVSKGFNFLALYAGGLEMITTVMLKTMDIFLSEADANKYRRKWRTLWMEVYQWQQKGLAKWQSGKLNATPLGRQYKAKLLTDYLNIENQGAGAEVAKLALHYFMRDYYFPKYQHMNVLICNFIHDCYILECDDDPEVYKPLCEDLAKCMQMAWFEMSKCFKIKDLPMPIKVSVGDNWGDIENDDIPNTYDYELEGMHYYEEANRV